MNYRKHKQSDNFKNKRMYTPEGYVRDPPDSKCPYCGESQKSCSNVNSLARAWARTACKNKQDKIKFES